MAIAFSSLVLHPRVTVSTIDLRDVESGALSGNTLMPRTSPGAVPVLEAGSAEIASVGPNAKRIAAMNACGRETYLLIMDVPCGEAAIGATSFVRSWIGD